MVNKTFDYGFWLVNDCHTKCKHNIFECLYEWGVWRAESGEWLASPRTNCLARLYVNETRVRANMDKYGFIKNKNFFNAITRIEGGND
jgi:hypothetical protein